MRAVLYARVSSEKQAEKDLSISAQLKALRNYAASHGYDIVREFIDEAESARTADRPAFQEMIALAKSKTKLFDAVLVWKLSRFARNREDSVIYKSILRKHGIQVTSINEQVDDSPAGLLLEGVIEVIDEFYSANLSQEARKGLREAASRGFFPGGTVPTGYKLRVINDDRTDRKALVVDDDFAPVIKRIFDLCLAGNGSKEIARTLNDECVKTRSGHCWTKATILYALKNQMYTGDFVWPHQRRLRRGEKQVVIKNHHPEIIDRQTYDAAQKLISARAFLSVHPRRVSSNYVLSGLLYCDKCGKAMLGGAAKSGRYRYYGCYSRIRISDSACSCRPINCVKIEKAVVDKLKDHVLTEENLIELLRLTNAEIAKLHSSNDKQLSELDRQLESRERRLDKLYDALEEGSISPADLSPRLNKLKSEVDQIRIKISEINISRTSQRGPITLNMAQLKRYVADLKALLLEGEYFEQKAFLKSFIQRIGYDYPQVSVQYTFPIMQS